MKQLVLPFLLAWIGGLFLVPLVRRIALRLGLVDRPDSRKIHAQPIPRIGGLALFVASFVGALPFLVPDSKTTGVMVAGIFIFLVGLLDDLLDLPPRVKLGGQILACLILFAFQVRIEFVTDFIAGQGLVGLGLLTYPVTLLWIIGLTNTVNLVDGVDGLAGGIVFIALSTLLAVRLLIPAAQDSAVIANVMVFCSALMGALLAFLRFNVFPASIFMGDSGAYFLGFMTAALSVAGAAKGSILLALIVPLVAFGLPVIDVCLAILRRRSKRVPIFQADREHLHHKLLHRGFTQAETTRFLWMVSSCFGLLAILAADIRHRGIETVIAFLFVAMVVACVVFFFRKVHEKRSA
ncbi:MAG: Undecaprenyl-phosphate N-acetylglucosaminyl 1-phosphate transferase [Candidatus Ozemobacter sibiricus]|uniref:Undecaprenyl-phosphate N-acetylglucosaminyl 1-phosphate transferase n=1 Tax=Candidatus Ozemobacter sibiricus TaxID=2268124 RepID=A0A367ZT17_9BACT|nr:MAG: Undecaprenyl-phosphate N-acetylglucosaminyl 1-phosphate transferase [Candidatus Ozemobacter sibiricus]